MADSFTVLEISAHPQDLERLREILTGINWELREARSCHEAMKVLCAWRMPVIVCDPLLPDGNWKDILSLTAPLLDPPKVIVMSDTVNDSLSAEVQNMHGYGVLAKPLEERELTRLLLAGRSSCRSVRAAATISEVNAA